MANFYKITKIIPALVLLTSLHGCNKFISGAGGEAPPPAESWAVVKISDGDTLKLRQTDGRELKIRFCGIDGPERVQPLGQESKANLQRLVDEAGGQVMVSVVEKDRYNRTVAEIFTTVNGQEKSLNEEQLKGGYAYLYEKYARKCPSYIAFKNAEAIAKSQNKGVWSQPTLEKPWDYRKRVREN